MLFNKKLFHFESFYSIYKVITARSDIWPAFFNQVDEWSFDSFLFCIFLHRTSVFFFNNFVSISFSFIFFFYIRTWISVLQNWYILMAPPLCINGLASQKKWTCITWLLTFVMLSRFCLTCRFQSFW